MKSSKYFLKIGLSLLLITIGISCQKKGPLKTDWNRFSEPVLRDEIDGEDYETASDAHVFFDSTQTLRMVYTGAGSQHISIKLATGSDWTSWNKETTLLENVGPSGLDSKKETPFYRKADNGKHQIFYIGYDNEDSYEAQIFMADADLLEGPYTQQSNPIVPKGIIAGKDVYCMTSPSIVEHEGKLYMSFIGWNNSPNLVTEVWILGATSTDDGYTWTDFQEVETKIGMEGQVTKAPDGTFYAVYTDEYKKNEGIFLSQSNHPFTGWSESQKPIILKTKKGYEVDEVIAPQLIFEPSTNNKRLYYTGADYKTGWWIMTATEY